MEIAPAAWRTGQRSITIDRLQLRRRRQHQRELVHKACARVIDPRRGPCILRVDRVDACVHQPIEQPVVDGITLLPLPVGAGDRAAIAINIPMVVEAPVGRDHRIDKPHRQTADIAVEPAIVGRVTTRGDAGQRHVLRRADTQQSITRVIGDVQRAFAVTSDTERPTDRGAERRAALTGRT